MPAEPTLRELNRATLARQLLLAREDAGVTDAVERLAGLQAQEPRPPFVALWSRLDGFARDDLHAALHAGDVVRATLMRATLHMVSRRDYAVVRPTLAPALKKAIRTFARDLDLDAVLPAARALLASGRGRSPSCAPSWPSASRTTTRARSARSSARSCR